METSTPPKAHVPDEVMMDCATVTLKGVLGETPANALLFHIGVANSIGEPSAFSKRLESVVGSGSVVLEKLIVRTLYRRLGIQFDESRNFNFEESVTEAGRILEERGKKS